MSRILISFIALAIAATYVGTSAKGENAPQERLYVRVFYCFDSQSVLKQRQSEKHKITAGYLLSSIDPNSDQMKVCAKDGTLMMGYVEVTPPFASPSEPAPVSN